MRYLSSLALGAATGTRSMIGVAGISWAQAQGKISLPYPLSLVGSPIGEKLTLGAEAGEMVVDKMPFAPNRTILPSELFRTAVGGFLGAVAAMVEGESLVQGAAVGAVSAALGNYAFYYLRRGVDALGVPNPFAGLAEDALAVAVVHYTVTHMEPRFGLLGSVARRLPLVG